MKLLVIDPWGIKTLAPYTNGFCYGLSFSCDLTLATNHFYENKTDADYRIYKLFFKKSEQMKDSLLRRIIRGFEYLRAYRKITKIVKREKFDAIEIEWCLMYRIDPFLIKRLKKYAPVIYKAHNVIPHEHGERKIGSLNKVYNVADYIVLHGKTIRDELVSLFPSIDQNKIIVQPFGTFEIDTSFKPNLLPVDLVKKVNEYRKRFIFFGGLFYNKGVDRLINIWIENPDRDALLIVAGKSSSDYHELQELKPVICNAKNILFLDEFVDDNTLNYLINASQAVILPYRHASMSGVLFTSAAFSKPVLCTDAGSLSEYFKDGEHGLLVHNDDHSLRDGINKLIRTGNHDLQKKGDSFNRYIVSSFSWIQIAKQLVGVLSRKLLKVKE